METKETIQHDPVEKPFITVGGDIICGFCGKKYKLIGAMKRHLEKNHGASEAAIFSCSKCKKQFDTKKKLTRHEKMKGVCGNK